MHTYIEGLLDQLRKFQSILLATLRERCITTDLAKDIPSRFTML
jgi:hypothetical protein